MSFSVSNLSVLAYANGFTLWHYKAGVDCRCDVAERGFFDTDSDMLASGDIMMVSAIDGSAMLCVTQPGNGDAKVSTAALG